MSAAALVVACVALALTLLRLAPVHKRRAAAYLCDGCAHPYSFHHEAGRKNSNSRCQHIVTRPSAIYQRQCNCQRYVGTVPPDVLSDLFGDAR